MRIERLELNRYGCFTDRELDLSGPGVHLVVGPNEAGKSTIRHAFADLLYGIHERTTLGFLHEMRDLRLTATLRGGNVPGEGPVLELVRLKQRKAPLQTPDGEPLADTALAVLLAGIDRAQFESTFAIGHEELRVGGMQLLAGDGDLGAALFETSTNRRLTGLMAAIDEEMGRLFKRKNAQYPLVNAALARIGEARRTLDGALLRPAEYTRVLRAKEEAEGLRDKLHEEMLVADTEYARFKRTMETKPILADLARLQAERAALEGAADGSASGPGPALADSAFGKQVSDQLAAVRERTNRSRIDADRAATDRGLVAEQLADLVVDERILAAEKDIERLHSERRAVEEAAEQGAREHKNAEKAGDQARLLVGRGHSSADQSHDADSPAGSAPTNAERAGALRAALSGVRAAELLPMAADKAKQVARLERAVHTLREKHGLPDTVSDWPPVPVPAREQVAAFKEQFDQFEARLRELTRNRREAAKALAHDRRDLDTVLAGDPPPSEADLARARAARDAAWLELRDRVLTVETGAAFDEAVRSADAMADRMRREAQRQTDRVRLEVAVAAGEQALAAVDVQVADLDRERGQAQSRWEAAWLPSALPAPDPHAAADLLAGIEALIAKAEELADTQVDLDVCRAEIAAAEVRLRQVLGYVGRADYAQAQADAGAQAQADAVADALAGAAADSATPANATPAEPADPTDPAGPAGPAGPSAFLAGAGLAELVALADQRREEYEAADKQREKADDLFAKAEALEAGAAAKAERVSRFAEAVAAVAAACGPSADAEPATDPYATIISLRERLLAAQHNATIAEQLGEQQSKLDDKLLAADAALLAAAADLAELITSAGVEDEAALDRLVQRVAAAADLDRRISDLTSPLARTGVPLPTLVLEAADWPDPDELAGRVAALKRARDELQTTLGLANEEFGARRKDLEAMDGSAAAAEAAVHLAEQQAVLIEHSEEYLRLHLGKQLLLKCMEEYRLANQDPVLAHAKDLFVTLTGGRFTDLFAEQDSHGKDVLRVRRANNAVVPIGRELSEGTLDQVYLSLRLAALQRFANAGRTMPLVFDDIFITSDDERTTAGLTALDGIADQFQVVVFTHHGHIADLAREALPAGRVHVTELPSSAS
ncbi:MAG TPA: AAA family ATPase [Actinocrinis sp.]|nr:AAA family ATPase [Actinocrinis sp.]